MASFVTLLALVASASAFVTGVDPNKIPEHSEPGMYGTNRCGTKDSPSSKCQTAWVNSATDFCFFSGPSKMPVGNFERIGVTYCTKEGHGARLVPKGTFRNVHYVETPHYIQITATGDFTKLNIPAGDDGGELDPHGADGKGNPIGGLVFGKGSGKAEQFENWTEFISHDQFCLRVCHNGGSSRRYCEHIYDVMGCFWNIPGNYGSGFEQCKGDDVRWTMGEYSNGKGGTSTWYQGVNPTPKAGAPAKSSKCSSFSSLPVPTYPSASKPKPKPHRL